MNVEDTKQSEYPSGWNGAQNGHLPALRTEIRRCDLLERRIDITCQVPKVQKVCRYRGNRNRRI